LPSGAELLASSMACRHQAFRVSDLHLWLTLSLEVTPHMIVEGATTRKSAPARVGSSADRSPCSCRSHEELADTIFGRWCSLVKARSPLAEHPQPLPSFPHARRSCAASTRFRSSRHSTGRATAVPEFPTRARRASASSRLLE
jgi:hypothetical protein